MNIRSVVGAACSAVAFGVALPAVAHGAHETVTPNFQHALPNVPGKSLTAVVVDYAPGAASPPHKHAGSAFIYAYVVSGDIESQDDDAPKRIYQAGGNFSEKSGPGHPKSRNASETKPAKLLAVFVADSDDKALTTPIK